MGTNKLYVGLILLWIYASQARTFKIVKVSVSVNALDQHKNMIYDV